MAVSLWLTASFLNDSGGSASTSPPDPINVYQEGLVIQNVPCPTPNTRPSIFFGSLHQAGTHWILMGVMNSLHQHLFRKEQAEPQRCKAGQSRIGMVIPKGISVPPASHLVPQFCQRSLKIVLFQVADYPVAGCMTFYHMDIVNEIVLHANTEAEPQRCKAGIGKPKAFRHVRRQSRATHRRSE
jgi:hypothetical protein